MNNELVPCKSQALAVAPRLSGVDIQTLIEKSIDAKSAVEVVKELRAMWQEDQKIAAESAFDAAMSALQSEMPIISKTKNVTDTGGNKLYSYEPLELIIQKVRPLLQKHGFNFTLDTDVESKDGWVIAKCLVTHTMGAKRESTAKFPLGAGTRAMSTTQIYAAALTFASRRVFCNAFGIITGGEDLDGQGEKPKAPGPSALGGKPNDSANKKKMVDLLRSVHRVQGYALDDAARHAMTQWLINETIIPDTQTVSDLAGDKLANAVAKVEQKLSVR